MTVARKTHLSGSFPQVLYDEFGIPESFEVVAMAQVIIEDLDPLVIEKLEVLAQEHGRSLQAELKHIIEAAIQAQTLNQPDMKTVTKTPEELGWPPGFFERTAGCFQDEPLVRYPQGELQERNWDDLSAGY